MNSQLTEKVYSILQTLYQNKFDISYLDNILSTTREVLKNLSNREKIILHNTKLEYQECVDILETSSLLHDVFNKQYLNNIRVNQKKEFINFYLNNHLKPTHLDIIYNIIDNISYLKEVKGLKKDLGKYEILRNIVSDAIKMDSIGINSIDKMIIYNNLSNNKMDHSRNINQHCKRKLFKIKNYIHTSYAKEVAITLEKQLRLIVTDQTFLDNYINNRLKIINLNTT